MLDVFPEGDVLIKIIPSISVVLYNIWTCHVIQRDMLYNRTCRRGVFGILILDVLIKYSNDVTFATKLAKFKPGEFKDGDLVSRGVLWQRWTASV